MLKAKTSTSFHYSPIKQPENVMLGFNIPQPDAFDPYSPTYNDQFGESELIKAFIHSNKKKFEMLYQKQASQSRVNAFMASVFLNGQNFIPELKIPEYALQKDSSGKTLLHYAAVGGVNLSEGYFKNYLLPRTVGQQDSHGVTALMLAAYNGQLQQVIILKQFEINMQNSDGKTALMFAAEAGQKQCMIELMDECYICDKNNYIFLDYLPKDFDKQFIKKACAKLKGIDPNRVTDQKKIETVDANDLLQVPQFKELYQQYINDLKAYEKDIQDRIKECTVVQQDVVQPPIVRIKDTFQQYLDLNIFPKNIKDVDDYIVSCKQFLENSGQLNKMLAQEKTDEISQRLTSIIQNLELQLPQICDHFKGEIEKIHLVLLYKQNDIHEDFDKVFDTLKENISSRKQKLQECVKQTNKLAYLDIKFQQSKDDCIEISKKFDNQSQTLYNKQEQLLQQNLDNAHDNLDLSIQHQLSDIVNPFKDDIKNKFNMLIQQVNDKMMMKIDEAILIKINQSYKKADAFAITTMPDVVTIKNFINCIQMIVKSSGKIINYSYYMQLYDLAYNFITSDDGLLQFIGDDKILPIQNIIPSISFIDDYFQVYHKQYKFSQEQFIMAMINELAVQYQPKIEISLVKFMKQFYYQQASSKIPEVLLDRSGTLKRQRINQLDDLNSQIDIGFSYFYLSVFALMNKCEIIKYSQVMNISYEQLTKDEQYEGTFSLFQPQEKQFYNCISPGWMHISNKNDAQIVVEPQFEMIEKE